LSPDFVYQNQVVQQVGGMFIRKYHHQKQDHILISLITSTRVILLGMVNDNTKSFVQRFELWSYRSRPSQVRKFRVLC